MTGRLVLDAYRFPFPFFLCFGTNLEKNVKGGKDRAVSFRFISGMAFRLHRLFGVPDLQRIGCGWGDDIKTSRHGLSDIVRAGRLSGK